MVMKPAAIKFDLGHNRRFDLSIEKDSSNTGIYSRSCQPHEEKKRKDKAKLWSARESFYPPPARVQRVLSHPLM